MHSPDQLVQTTLRIPKSMLDDVDKSAATNRRSRNAQILWCIEFATDMERSFAEAKDDIAAGRTQSMESVFDD